MSGFCNSPLARRRVLYTDTIEGGQQAMRDDLWAVTTEELNYLHNTIKQAKIIEGIQAATIERLREQQNAQRPDFLLNGTRFKLNFSTRGNVDVFHNYASELQGRWVALVPAEDDMHLVPAAPLSADAVIEAREQALEEAAEALDAMNDSSGDAAAYDGREQNMYELEREHAISACAAKVRSLKRPAAGAEGVA